MPRTIWYFPGDPFQAADFAARSRRPCRGRFACTKSGRGPSDRPRRNRHANTDPAAPRTKDRLAGKARAQMHRRGGDQGRDAVWPEQRRLRPARSNTVSRQARQRLPCPGLLRRILCPARGPPAVHAARLHTLEDGRLVPNRALSRAQTAPQALAIS